MSLRHLLLLPLLLASATQAAPLDANLLLGGSDFPASLELPASWLPTLREMQASSAHDGYEQSSCVMLDTTEDRHSLQQAAIDYSSAAWEAPGTTTLANATSTLLQELKAADLPGSLSLSAVENGQESSIVSTCSGSFIGHLHTHPQFTATTASLSDFDAKTFLEHGLPLSGVISGRYMCVALAHPANADRPLLEPVDFGMDLLLAEAGAPAGSIYQDEPGLARFLDRNHAALYCGSIGASLPRIAAQAPAGENPHLLVLAAKAWLVALRNYNHPEWPAPNFPFDTSVDPAFLAWLKPRLNATGQQALARWKPENSDYRGLLRLIVQHVNAGAGSQWSNGFTLPDNRFGEVADAPRFQFTCSGGNCQLTRRDNVGDPARIYANYWSHGDLQGLETSTSASTALRIKAWVLALKWREHPEWPAAEFPFTPELDPAFRDYLLKLWPAAPLDASEADIFNGLRQALPFTFPLGWSYYDGMPDSGPDTFSFMSNARQCALAPINHHDFFVNQPLVGRAFYDSDGRYLTVDSVGDHLVLHNHFSDGSQYDGDTILVNNAWQPEGHGIQQSAGGRYIGSFHAGQSNGQGRLETASYIFEGGFVDGEPEGDGRAYDRKSSTWHKAHADHGQITMLD